MNPTSDAMGLNWGGRADNAVTRTAVAARTCNISMTIRQCAAGSRGAAMSMFRSAESTVTDLNSAWQRLVQHPQFRVALVTATGCLLAYSYKTVNESFTPRYDFALPIDAQIPFLPWSGLIYWSYFGLFIGGAYVIRPAQFTRLWVGVLVCNLASYLMYCLFTAHVPHPDISYVQPVWLNGMYRRFYLLDDPGNTLPSLHCALSGLLGWNVRKHSPLWLVWAVAIALSTLTTKEHVLLDLLGGWLLAGIVQWTIVRPGLNATSTPSVKFLATASATTSN